MRINRDDEALFEVNIRSCEFQETVDTVKNDLFKRKWFIKISTHLLLMTSK